jgi:hypothetical protein
LKAYHDDATTTHYLGQKWLHRYRITNGRNWYTLTLTADKRWRASRGTYPNGQFMRRRIHTDHTTAMLKAGYPEQVIAAMTQIVTQTTSE